MDSKFVKMHIFPGRWTGIKNGSITSVAPSMIMEKVPPGSLRASL
jgi:hypothetical protein